MAGAFNPSIRIKGYTRVVFLSNGSADKTTSGYSRAHHPHHRLRLGGPDRVSRVANGEGPTIPCNAVVGCCAWSGSCCEFCWRYPSWVRPVADRVIGSRSVEGDHAGHGHCELSAERLCGVSLV